ncbi:MAG: amidohydrolase family protein [Parashewanella sp.]
MINISKVAGSITFALSAVTLLAPSQTVASVPIVQPNSKVTAFTHANIYVSPEKFVKNATLLIQDNRIKAILDNDDIPKNALSINLSGYTIYPGFIDPFSQYGIEYNYPTTKKKTPIYDIERVGGNAENSAIHSEREWFSYIKPNKKSAKNWIDNGFTSVQSAKLDGIFRGRGVALSLAENTPNNVIYQSRSRQFMAFNKGTSKQDYPRSLMGSIALIRQTLADAKWYNENYSKPNAENHLNNVEFNAALEKLNNIDKQQIIFESKNLNNQLRAARVLSEFGLTATQVASGHEYARIDEVKALNYSLIVPLNFPKAPDVVDADKAREINLSTLRHWERAPSNPAELAKADINFSFTMNGIKSKDFWPRIRKAVKAGLPESVALAALTTNPAEQADIDNIAGKLEPGFMADFVISKGNLFKDGEIYSVWLQGKEKALKDLSVDHIIGDYQLTIDQLDLDLSIERDKKLSASISSGEDQITPKNIRFHNGRLTFTADMSHAGYQGTNRFVLWLDKDELTGRMITAQGETVAIAAKRNLKQAESIKTVSSVNREEGKTQSFVSQLTQPNIAYGITSKPTTDDILFKNATVWTSENDGILKNTDVLISDGEIEEIGTDLSAPRGYKVIDATGKHLTAGIIDEHSHIAINGGVNEGTYSVTSEVRIGDVINPDDISIYRALAGGVTTAQLLHGSANPIGGQAQTIKMRWGDNAEALKFKQAHKSIKFALGENVKQNHWGDNFNRRFPKSRMGVDALFRQTFDAANDYQVAHQQWDDLRRSQKRKRVAPKTDYRLEAISEILNHDRDIHIHSYVASEILMFLKVAETYNFTVKAFTHVLEGYKVADELAKHGAGASTFSDWWAYKFEVYDAIPQNTCLMNRKGVVTSINSDDYEMQRRLNQEAAKSLFYCDMSAADAWKMITINPAKQLGIDEFVGSIKQGKSADLVLWDHNPLSVYAKAEKVWIDGKQYFDRKQDQQAQLAVAAERDALIQKILGSDAKAKAGDTIIPTKEPQWHCDTDYHAWNHNNHHSH